MFFSSRIAAIEETPASSQWKWRFGEYRCSTEDHDSRGRTASGRGVKLVSVPGPLQAYLIWSGPDQWNHCRTSCYK